MSRNSAQGRPVVTITEAAHLLGISRKTVRKLMDEGHLPWFELPGVRGRRIRREDVAALIEAGYQVMHSPAVAGPVDPELVARHFPGFED